MKKFALVLCLAVLTPFAGAKDFAGFMEGNSEVAVMVGDALSAAAAGAAAGSVVSAASGAYKYNYTPAVFELTTTHYKHIYVLNGIGERVNMDYKNEGAWGEGAGYYDAKCYGTLLNKDYMLTHKNCLEIPDMEYKDPDLPGSWIEWEPLSMKFKKDGRELYFNMKSIGDNYWIDEKSGAALVKISNLCLHKHATSASNVCINFWEWAFNSDPVKFKVNSNYGTVILSNINAEDNVEDSFLGRAFFVPNGDDRTAASAKKGVLTLKGSAKKTPLAEPLFHRADGGKNILVGIKMPSESIYKTWEYTKTNNYALFSSNFTKLIKNNVKTGGIKLTKDLKGVTSL